MKTFLRGSSPRMWGTLGFEIRKSDGSRFIPTHVGNTASAGSETEMRSVHPHACGEHSGNMGLCCSWSGSSPRMWGTHIPASIARDSERFIPTHVGNTPEAAHRQRIYPVHPHACGEHIIFPKPPVGMVGSSPRMWGTHNQFIAACLLVYGSSPRMWGTHTSCNYLI